MAITEVMSPRIAELATQLEAFTQQQRTQPTQQDRDALMALRNKIKRLGDGGGTTLTETEETDRQYLYVESTRAANEQEDFYERNGNKWATA